MIKYKTTRQAARIEAVEVLRETKAHVFLADGRHLKMSETGDCYHNTWQDAHAELTARAKVLVQRARRQLEIAKSYEGNVKGLREKI